MRVGIISSSHGYTFEQMCRGVEHLDVNFAVVTDRACGIEDVSAARGLPCERIVSSDRREFSQRAAAALKAQSVDFVLLFFNRLILAEIYEAMPTYNIHPALLPAFPGLKALKEAREREVRFVGATLHLVTEGADEGPIVAQVSAPVWPPVTETQLAEMSFVQRVYLSLLAVELEHEKALVASPSLGEVRHVSERPYSARCNPAIQDTRMLELIRTLEVERGVWTTR